MYEVATVHWHTIAMHTKVYSNIYYTTYRLQAAWSSARDVMYQAGFKVCRVSNGSQTRHSFDLPGCTGSLCLFAKPGPQSWICANKHLY